MIEFNSIGKILIFLGGALMLTGAIVIFAGKIPGAGRMPGDILIQKKNFTLFLPITTSILISAFLSIILYFLSKR